MSSADVDPRFLTSADRDDIQSIVLHGTTAEHMRFHFFRVMDAPLARIFVGSVPVTLAGAIQSAPLQRQDLTFLAVTAAGLRVLGVAEHDVLTFPTEFLEGPRKRAELMGDTHSNAPQHWAFNPDDVHLLVIVHARDVAALEERSSALVASAQAQGCALVQQLTGQALPGEDGRVDPRRRYVHFGFRDGITNPRLLEAPPTPAAAAVPASAGTTGNPPRQGEQPSVPPGMFVLGHPDRPPVAGRIYSITNEPLPEPRELTHNGTFAAFRMLEQDCDAFEQYLDDHSTSALERERLAASFVGRWRNGVPLTLSPNTPDPTPPVAADAPFDYRGDEGTGCPIGSHVRRMNPRSSRIHGQMGDRIRLIRRGITYGPPHKRGDGEKRGILGLFLCASLARQYEFIMRHWINDGAFARGLAPDQRDPLIGAPVEGNSFTYVTAEGSTRTVALAQFVTTKAAAYLFFPSRSGLQLLARGPRQASPHSTSGRLEFVAARAVANVGTGVVRDAHPKHHGIVKGTFQVMPDLPADLRYGVFTPNAEYRAYLRFSNGFPDVNRSDAEPDARGLGIKLMGINGRRLMGDERHTQDFILLSHDVFFVKDLAEYIEFLNMEGPARAQRFPLLLENMGVHDNPLTIPYFSQTPYRCGPSIVKYAVRPVAPAGAALPPEARTDPNFLRAAMARTLAQGSVTFEFQIQRAAGLAGVDEDDATQRWLTPFVTVARIRVPKQDFLSAAQMQFAEAISFNPWRGLVAHEPVGSINLARRGAYTRASARRHLNSGMAEREPNGFSDF